MPDQNDRVGTLGADKAPAGLSNFPVMKSDPVWAQLAGEVAVQQNLVKELRTQFNALCDDLTKTSFKVLPASYPDPKL